MELELAKSLAKLFAQKFIARPDLIANQLPDGSFRPARDPQTKRITEGFNMENLLAHLKSERTLGHYLINPENNQVKLFVLDVDLRKTGYLPTGYDADGTLINWHEFNPRATWMNRVQGPPRAALKYQMHLLAHTFVRIIETELAIPARAQYSGAKGLHIYGFTGPTDAERARKGALIALEAAGWKLSRGNNIFQPMSQDPDNWSEGATNFEIEVYPKQDTLEDKDLGNLVRLPLGRNLHSPRDIPFFIDMRAPLNRLYPMDPWEALTTTDIFAYQDEIQRRAA